MRNKIPTLLAAAFVFTLCGNFLDGTMTGKGGVVYALRTDSASKHSTIPTSPSGPARSCGWDRPV